MWGIIATWRMAVEGISEASHILQEKGISAEEINIHTLKPIDSDLILKSCQKTGKAITIEEHSVINGLGSAVADILIREYPVKIKMIGVEDNFSIVGSTYHELIDYYGFSADKLAVKINDFLQQF